MSGARRLEFKLGGLMGGFCPQPFANITVRGTPASQSFVNTPTKRAFVSPKYLGCICDLAWGP